MRAVKCATEWANTNAISGDAAVNFRESILLARAQRALAILFFFTVVYLQ
jgi:hypothetical protein